MIIAQMNKYFTKHGRIIGIVIVIIISVMFVLFFGGMNVFDNILGSKSKVVKILGRSVDRNTRQEEVKKIILWNSLHIPFYNLTSPNIQLDSQRINQNLLLSYAAEDMGIIIGDKTVEDYIKTAPIFQKNGNFDSQKYESYVKNKLKPAYYKTQDLKEAVREMLQLQAMRETITQSVIVPEEEVKGAYFLKNTKVEAKLLKFDYSKYSKKIVFKDDEIKNYFNTNKEKYKTTPSAKGKLVFFKYDDFKKEADKQITAKEIEDYYKENKSRYMKKKEPEKKKLKKGEKPPKPEYVPEPLEKVKDKIRKVLAEKEIKVLAFKKAQNFADNLSQPIEDVFNNVSGKLKIKQRCIESFITEAKKQKLPVKDSGWLYEGLNTVPGFGRESKVVKTMNSLFDDNPLSEPIKGLKGVFVLILEANKGPQSRNFEEVKDIVRKDLIKIKALSRAKQEARNAVVEIKERLKKGQSIDAIETELKLKFNKLPQISEMNPPREGRVVQQLAFATPIGNISNAEETAQGALIVYVVKRIIPTEKEFNKEKKDFSKNYKRDKGKYAFRDYISSLIEVSHTASQK